MFLLGQIENVLRCLLFPRVCLKSPCMPIFFFLSFFFLFNSRSIQTISSFITSNNSNPTKLQKHHILPSLLLTLYNNSKSNYLLYINTTLSQLILLSSSPTIHTPVHPSIHHTSSTSIHHSSTISTSPPSSNG